MKAIQNFDLRRRPFQYVVRYQTPGQVWDKYHAHQGMEFLYVHEGEGVIFCDQQIIPFYPGYIMYFQPYQLHRVRVDLSPGQKYIRSKLIYEPELFYGKFNSFPFLQQFFMHLWKGQFPLQVVDCSKHSESFERILDWLTPSKESGEQLKEQFTIFLVCFLKLLQPLWVPAEEKPKSRSLHHAEKALQWIEVHFRENFDLNKMAQELFITPQYLSRLFRISTGSTITEYIMSRRLREACILLTTTEWTIQEISMQLGISKVSYFCKVFKNTFGLSPLQYRKSLSDNERS